MEKSSKRVPTHEVTYLAHVNDEIVLINDNVGNAKEIKHNQPDWAINDELDYQPDNCLSCGRPPLHSLTTIPKLQNVCDAP